MDINLAIDHLGLNANSYKLTQSIPPHSIVEWDGPDSQPTEAELEAAYTAAIAELAVEQAKQNRAAAYTAEADPLFFKWQAGEVTEAEWRGARDAIRARFPYPDEVTP